MKEILKGILLVLAMTLLLTTNSFAATTKMTILPETLWENAPSYWAMSFENTPEDVQLLTITSSNKKVISVQKWGNQLDEHYLQPLKAGKSKLTVVYKTKNKKYTINKTFTVKKNPYPISSLKVAGKTVDTKKNPFRYLKNGYKKTSLTVDVKLKKGWRIAYVNTPKEMGWFEVESKYQKYNGKSSAKYTIKQKVKGYNAVNLTFENNAGELYDYEIVLRP